MDPTASLAADPNPDLGCERTQIRIWVRSGGRFSANGRFRGQRITLKLKSLVEENSLSFAPQLMWTQILIWVRQEHKRGFGSERALARCRRQAYLPGAIQNLRTGKLTTTASRVLTTEAMVPASVASMPRLCWQKLMT